MKRDNLSECGQLQLCYWGYAEGDSSIRMKLHSHDFYQANFTLEGSCELVLRDGKRRIGKNDLVVIAPGVAHMLRYPEKYLCHCYKFHGDFPGMPQILHVRSSPFTCGVIQAADIILKTTFPDRFFGIREGTIILPQDRYQLLMEHYLSGVLASCLSESRWSGLPARIRDTLEKRGSGLFGVAEAAEACCYSRNHFSMLIRQATGLTAKDFLNQLRLESAKRHLRYSSRSIGEIASELGFSSQFHFSDFFRRMTGISPRLYRKGTGEEMDVPVPPHPAIPE